MGAFPHIRFAARTDIGRKRTNNEDAFGAFPSSGIFCVADGMGGGDDGEVASAATIGAVERFTKECPISERFTYPIEGIVAGIRSAVNSASSWIANRTRQKGLKGCGSTFAGICFDAARPTTAIALHAGDSRLYRVRGRSIERMTVDHSAAELIGARDDEDVNPMFRGMILRAVGILPSADLERTEVPLKVRDRILICTDGLSKMVNDRRLLSIIRAGEDLEATADRLIAAANDAGGVDNITVVLIEVGEFPAPLSTSPLVNGDGTDAVRGKDWKPTDVPDTHGTEDLAVLDDASTEDDFIPSTARDDEGEDTGRNTGEGLNIPESDTEDDLPGEVPSPGADAGVIPKVSRRAGITALVGRLLTNRFVLAGLIFVLILVGVAIAHIYSRATAAAEAKRIAETKNHVREQKDSLQTFEEKRKTALEQKAREAEEEKTRSEIQTPAKQKELSEKAREAAARREREEVEAKAKAAREEAIRQEQLRRAEEEKRLREAEEEAKAKAAREEAIRQEQLRKAEAEKRLREAERRAEELRQQKAEEEAKAKAAREEAIRQEQLRRAEEERRLREAERRAEELRKAEELRRRKAEEEAKAKAAREEAIRQEQLRKAEEAKALADKQEQERKAREAEEKQDLAIRTLMSAVADAAVDGFCAKIRDCIPNSIPSDFRRKLARVGSPGLSRAERIAAITGLTEDVQRVSRGLMEYSSLTLANIDSDLADATNERQTKDSLTRIREGIMAFARVAGEFIGQDAADPDVQMKCARIIRLVPEWFDF